MSAFFIFLLCFFIASVCCFLAIIVASAVMLRKFEKTLHDFYYGEKDLRQLGDSDYARVAKAASGLGKTEREVEWERAYRSRSLIIGRHFPDASCEGDAAKPQEKKAIPDLVREAHLNAVGHGWWDGGERDFGLLLMLIVSEASEALEEYRHNHPVVETYYSLDNAGVWKMEGVPSELADIVIRVFDLCGHYGIDLDAAIAQKMAYNKTRPMRHGGKKC